MRPFLGLAVGFSLFLHVSFFTVALRASPGDPGPGEPAAGVAEETADLPVWQEGDCRESFEVRLWPARTLNWLERENLHDRIADPALPDSERAKLKQILGFSRRWRMHSSMGNALLD